MRLTGNHKNLLPAFVTLIIFGLSVELSAQTDSGKPFPQLLFPSFTKGIIVMKSGQKNSALLNYSTVDEEMVFKQNGVYLALEKPEDVDTVYIQNRKFVYGEKAFYEILATGSINVYIQNKGHYTSVGTNTAYGLTSQTNGSNSTLMYQAGNQIRNFDLPDNITVSPSPVYWVKKKGEMFKFTNERQFVKIFPEKETEIKEFIKSSKIDIKVREDLTKLGDFCNTLYK